MSVEWVAETLREVDAHWATPHRVALLDELSSVYSDNKVVVDGYGRALHQTCPSRTACWADAEDREPDVYPLEVGRGESGSISWPWIGENYERGGVGLISLNLNFGDGEAGNLVAEYQIAEDVVRSFEAGDRTPWGSSMFMWRTLATAHAVLASLSGNEPADQPANTIEALTSLERIARVQAVKCTPRGERSYPTPAMRQCCPERFTIPELGVLRPGTLVALGNDAYNAMAGLPGLAPSWTEKAEHFWRGGGSLHGDPVDLLWIYHPTAHGDKWARGQGELVASLKARPLRTG